MTNYSLETRKAEIEKITKEIVATLENNTIISVTDGIAILDSVKALMPIYKKLEEKAEAGANIRLESEPIKCGCCSEPKDGNENEEYPDDYPEDDFEDNIKEIVKDVLEALLSKI